MTFASFILTGGENGTTPPLLEPNLKGV